jgi:hypothetical protein
MDLNLTHAERTQVVARIASELTICARETYEAGTENILEPQLLRAYNELQHRVAAAVLSHLCNTDGFSLETIIEMLKSFGLQRNRAAQMKSVINRALTNTAR